MPLEPLGRPVMGASHVWNMGLLDREKMIRWIRSGYLVKKLPWQFKSYVVSLNAEYAVVKYLEGKSASLTPDEEGTLQSPYVIKSKS